MLDEPFDIHSFLISSKVWPEATYMFHGWELHQEGESNDMVIISFNISSGMGLDWNFLQECLYFINSLKLYLGSIFYKIFFVNFNIN